MYKGICLTWVDINYTKLTYLNVLTKHVESKYICSNLCLGSTFLLAHRPLRIITLFYTHILVIQYIFNSEPHDITTHSNEEPNASIIYSLLFNKYITIHIYVVSFKP